MTLPTLVVIVGPIASGKSTVAAALARRFREAGRAVALLDLDDHVETFGGFIDLPPERFEQAQVVFGTLVGAWLAEGVDVVAHGPFFQRREDEALLHAVPAGIVPRRVRLHCTLEVALQRVEADPDRMLSAFPGVLKETYDRVEQLVPAMPPSEWVFDTTKTDAHAITDHLAGDLLG